MKWLHNLLKGLSLTAALFVFQACYGTPEGLEPDIDMGDNPASVEVVSTPETPAIDALAPEMPETDPEAGTGE
ncbi:MAG: hypothetical protein IKX34_09115 [Bacteroidales bacterium]|nr:hypothetical protein [Bacteroidales bacterium]